MDISSSWRASSRIFDGEVENPTVRDVLRAIGDLRSSVDDLRKEVKAVQEAVMKQPATIPQDKQGPSGVGDCIMISLIQARVRRIYRGLGDLEWIVGPNDCFRSTHNGDVTNTIIQAIKDGGENLGPENVIRKACNRFYENLKAQHKADLEGRMEGIKKNKKMNSRHDRLFKQRLQVAKDLLEEDDFVYLKGSGPQYMSDEESGEEDKALYRVLQPRWRHSKLSRILHRCQQALESNAKAGRKPACQRQRIMCGPSPRLPPVNKPNYVAA
ncbi:hypothetical protein ACEWY4_000069 [Coilia grayii]|uniref:Uncharacterized protein n=1 Tax=Coilia grayii TaxID=363190 RepID=A0ABD1KW71_9TELE